MISVFKNNIFYFKATPVNGLYTVNLQDNSSEIYHISKRSKDIEDQTYLWHCRLGHINKKRVELLLKGGFLGTFDYKAFDNCESCLSGKMTKQHFNKENERATDLLEICNNSNYFSQNLTNKERNLVFNQNVNQILKTRFITYIRNKTEQNRTKP
ncbi:hypothetical protein OSB04_020766 [Centaurea solstitialis]|uniref:GAG-pre-integrase domain-containing protein n=1 Tax=Centaurea solstitialis TaxID=347529 RepID=A0AA38T0K4_9ASTR|nr:hypothetical protein OSB04_020766 [Centaurea solstitialis]